MVRSRQNDQLDEGTRLPEPPEFTPELLRQIDQDAGRCAADTERQTAAMEIFELEDLDIRLR